MSAPRLTTLAIKGIITTPNEFGVYPEGSCALLQNFRALSANQWHLARDINAVIVSGANTLAPYRTVGLSPGVFLAIYADHATYTTWVVYLNGNSSTAFTVNAPMTLASIFDGDGYLTPTIARSRLYLNSKKGVIVLDDLAPATAGARNFRCAGLPKPRYGGLNYSAEPVIPANVVVTYAMVVRRRSADGYIMVSPPSVPVKFWASTDAAPYLTYQWDYLTHYQVGDEAELYRTAGILDATNVASAGTSMRQVATVVLTAAHIAARFVRIDDEQPMKAPLYETEGAEIYTSPYQEGETGASLAPPVCKTCAQWGAYTFYGNVVDDITWTLDVPAGVGDSYFVDLRFTAAEAALFREHGLGIRLFDGTRTIGSPTITGVSATHMLGIVPGQLAPIGFPPGTHVLSRTASTVTMTANATTAGTVDNSVQDILQLNGTDVTFVGFGSLMFGIQSVGELDAFPSEPIDYASFAGYDLGITALFRPTRPGRTSITLRATNGQNYSPALPEISATVQTLTPSLRPNLLRWSKYNQPESVPTPNEAFIGAGTIIRLLATTDCLWVLCTDGAYRLSGEAGVWRADLIDPTFVPIAPDACCVLNEVVYAYTPRGFCSLGGVQTQLLSRGVIDDYFPQRQFSATRLVQMYADPSTEEILTLFQDATIGNETVVMVYSTLYKQWSTFRPTSLKRCMMAPGTFLPSGTGQSYPIFGVYSSTPAIHSWRYASGGGSYVQGIMDMQPYYIADPLKMKRWIDATLVTGPREATVVALYLGSDEDYSGFSTTKLAGPGAVDARASMGILAAHARLPSIKPYFTVVSAATSDANVVTVKAVSLRYAGPKTTQQRSR